MLVGYPESDRTNRLRDDDLWTDRLGRFKAARGPLKTIVRYVFKTWMDSLAEQPGEAKLEELVDRLPAGIWNRSFRMRREELTEQADIRCQATEPGQFKGLVPPHEGAYPALLAMGRPGSRMRC